MCSSDLFDKRRIRNHSNWLNAFDVLSWTLVAVTGVFVGIVASTRFSAEGRLQVAFRVSDSFDLLRGDGTAHNKFHLMVLIYGCVLTGYYENHLTSLLLAPNPPLVYGTVRDLFEAGYKIRNVLTLLDTHTRAGVMPAEVGYARAFERHGILHLVNNSFVDATPANWADMKLRTIPVEGLELASFVKQYNLFFRDKAACHNVPQPFVQGIVSWMSFAGQLSDHAYVCAHWLLQAGFYTFWREVHRARFERDTWTRKWFPNETDNKGAQATAVPM